MALKVWNPKRQKVELATSQNGKSKRSVHTSKSIARINMKEVGLPGKVF
jgi:hypothetical protein